MKYADVIRRPDRRNGVMAITTSEPAHAGVRQYIDYP